MAVCINIAVVHLIGCPRVCIDLLVWLAIVAPALASQTSLGQRIDKIVRSYPKVQLSIHVIRADDGHVLYAHQATQPLIPASNIKLVTTAAALRLLGPDFTYVTTAYLADSNLVIVGSGDPLLGDSQIDSKYQRPPGWVLASIVQALCHRSGQGISDIVLDTTVFDDQRIHPNWPVDQLNRWYASEVCGLNYNCNCVYVTVSRQPGGISVTVDPDTRYVTFINKVRQVDAGRPGVGAYRQPGQPNTLLLKGTCKRQEGPFDVAIERPAMMLGFLLAESLTQAGIPVTGRLVERATRTQERLVPICQFRTSLPDCLARCNKDSLGLAAESLLKTMAAHRDPTRPGSWPMGRTILSEYLAGLGVPRVEFSIDDGSGLSRHNRLSARCLTAVLSDMYRSPHRDLFISSLAVAGEDGTLGRYFLEPSHRGKILGKTGYLDQVRCLSGICLNTDGPVIFSLLANRTSGNGWEVISAIARALLQEDSKPTWDGT